MLKKMMYSGGIVLPKARLINNSAVGSALVDFRLSSDPDTGALVLNAAAGEQNSGNLFTFDPLDCRVYVSGDGPYNVHYTSADVSGNEEIFSAPPDDPRTTLMGLVPVIKITIEDVF